MTQHHNPALQLALQQAIQEKPKRQQVKEVGDLLYKRYAVFRQFKPLAIGMHEEVIAALPQYPQPVVKRVIQRHCSTVRYLKALVRENNRHRLNGAPSATLTDEERLDAQRRLDTAIARQQAEKVAPVGRDNLEKPTTLDEVRTELNDIVRLMDDAADESDV